MKSIYNIKKEDLIKMYVDNDVSTNNIAKKYGCTPHTIRHWLRKYDIPRRQKNGRFQEPFYVEGNYFKTWSQDMAWVLGYVVADGCIRKKKYELRIKSIDYEMLEFVQKQLKTNYEIKTEKGSRCYYLAIYSKKIVDDMYRLGVTDKKSLTVDLPKIDIKYFWSFLRGLIDGDGHIFPIRNNSRIIGFQITSSYYMLNSIMDLLEKEIGMPKYKINPQGKAGVIGIHGKWAYKLLKRTYDNSFYGLSRKKNIALKSIIIYENRINCIDCGRDIVFADIRRKRCTQCAFTHNQKQWSEHGKRYYEKQRKDS